MPPEAIRTLFRDYRRSDRDWVTAANVHYYRSVEGFDVSFAATVSSALDLLETSLEVETSRFVIVEECETSLPVGCAFFAADQPKVGRLRLVYLDHRYQGLGIARAMIEDVIAHAKSKCFDSICVSTFDRHVAACRLYEALGFRAQSSAQTAAFGQQMRQIDFEKILSERS